MYLIAKFHYKIYPPESSDFRAFSEFERALTFGLKFHNYRKRFFSVVLPFRYFREMYICPRAIWENNVFGAKYHRCELAI